MLTSVLCVCVVTNILHEGLHIVSFNLGCCTSNYNLPATLPPGEGIGAVHLRPLREGCPYGSASAFFRIIKKRYSCIRTVGMIYYQ